MFFALGGTAFAYHADGAEAIRAGQMLVLDADRPFIRGFSDNYDEVYLKIPRSVFLRECGAETLAHPRVIAFGKRQDTRRSEEHTSELQSLMRNSYDVFCLHKQQTQKTTVDPN